MRTGPDGTIIARRVTKGSGVKEWDETVLRAIVTDRGGRTSHAAIVSRELGVPCVVSLANASKTLPSGTLVDLDGSTGTVTVVESA